MSCMITKWELCQFVSKTLRPGHCSRLSLGFISKCPLLPLTHPSNAHAKSPHDGRGIGLLECHQWKKSIKTKNIYVWLGTRPELANTNSQDGFPCVAWWHAHLLLIQGALWIEWLRGGGGMSFGHRAAQGLPGFPVPKISYITWCGYVYYIPTYTVYIYILYIHIYIYMHVYIYIYEMP